MKRFYLEVLQKTQLQKTKVILAFLKMPKQSMMIIPMTKIIKKKKVMIYLKIQKMTIKQTQNQITMKTLEQTTIHKLKSFLGAQGWKQMNKYRSENKTIINDVGQMILSKMTMKRIMMIRLWQRKDLRSFKMPQGKLELVKLNQYRAISIMKIPKVWLSEIGFILLKFMVVVVDV